MTKFYPHPAKFSLMVWDVIVTLADFYVPALQGAFVLDPFAGTGIIHRLRSLGYETLGVEIEPEWAHMSPYTVVGDATNLPVRTASVDLIVTSPTYGNRMADHHNAKDGSKRNTYKHTLGRDLHPNNSGQMQWGEKYRALHRLAWKEAYRVLKPGGFLVLNCKDHVRGGEVQEVTAFHQARLQMEGFEYRVEWFVKVPGFRQGANGNLRVEEESVSVWKKPEDEG